MGQEEEEEENGRKMSQNGNDDNAVVKGEEEEEEKEDAVLVGGSGISVSDVVIEEGKAHSFSPSEVGPPRAAGGLCQRPYLVRLCRSRTVIREPFVTALVPVICSCTATVWPSFQRSAAGYSFPTAELQSLLTRWKMQRFILIWRWVHGLVRIMRLPIFYL